MTNFSNDSSFHVARGQPGGADPPDSNRLIVYITAAETTTIRVRTQTRDRLKALAARRGESGGDVVMKLQAPPMKRPCWRRSRSDLRSWPGDPEGPRGLPRREPRDRGGLRHPDPEPGRRQSTALLPAARRLHRGDERLASVSCSLCFSLSRSQPAALGKQPPPLDSLLIAQIRPLARRTVASGAVASARAPTLRSRRHRLTIQPHSRPTKRGKHEP